MNAPAIAAYCAEVVSCVRCRFARAAIASELTAHMEDLSFDNITLTSDAPRTDDDVFGEFTSTEYQALLFASPSIARVEARQQVTENNGAADWAADAGAPVAGSRLTDGVWQVRYTESRSNEQMQHTRFVGYDADGNLFEAVYAPVPPFA